MLSVLLILLGGCGEEGRTPLTHPSGREAPSPETMEREETAAEKTGPPAGLSAGEWKQVTAQINADRLRFRWDEAAPLRGEDMPGAYRALHAGGSSAAWMSADGLVVRPLHNQDEQAQWKLELALEGVGRAGQPSRRRLKPGRTTVEGDRLEIERGGVLEWYENTSEGLQQGFVVDQRPPVNEMGDGELRVILAARGGLTPKVEPGGRDARFVDDTGESVLGYTGLVAWDARGEALEARMEAHGQRLDLVVDDAEAVYPVTIDPFLNPEDQKLVASDGASSDVFGSSVSLSGTTLAVGAYGEDSGGLSRNGAVYIFEHDGTSWVERQKLLASDRATNDNFGRSVSLSGTMLAVGAHQKDSGGLSDNGAVYVFEHDGTSWVEEQKLLASDGANSDAFGWQVSLSGTTLAVTAFREASGGLSGNGAVYVFEHDGTSWVEEQKLLASDKATDDKFGWSVSLSGTRLAVGAFREDSSGLTDNGAVYVFEHDGTSWVEEQKLLASDKASGDVLGTSVSLSGTTLAVGAPYEDSGGLSYNGAVYVFEHDGTSWVEEQKLLASDKATDDRFGQSVSLSGTRLAVGAHGEDSGGLSDNGAVYVFEHDGTSWVEGPKLLASDKATNDVFGGTVSLSGTTLAVAAHGADSGGLSGNGAAYIFEDNRAPAASDQAVTTDEEVGVTVTLSATDADGDALTYAIVDGPTDGTLSGFDAAAGTVIYTPDADFNGSDSFTFEANDGTDDSSTATVSITVSPVNDAPAFTSSPPTSVDEDTAYIYAVTATDVEGDTLAINATTLPSWLTLTDNGDGTATLAGIPTNTDVGTHAVILEVSDGTASGTQSFDITVANVNDAPTFDSAAVTAAIEDMSYTYAVAASDIDGDTLTINATTLPGWLTFVDNGDGTASLTGTPTNNEAGTHPVVLEVSDGSLTDTQTFDITVANVNDAPVAAGNSVTTDEEAAVTVTLAASDIDGDSLAYTVVTSPTNGTLSGTTPNLTYTPDADFNGSDSFTFKANDGTVDSNTATVSITVSPVNDAPAFTSTAVTSATQDLAYSYSVAASDIDGDTLTINATTLPSWLTFTDNGDGTARLTGTPTNGEVGTHPVVLEVSDGTATDTQSFDITVANVNDAPVFVAPTPADREVFTVVEADTLEMTLAADDSDADTLTYDVAPLPSGATLDAATGAFSWTPTWQDAGTYQLTLSVTDGALSDSRQVTVEVSFIDADADGLPDTWETENGLDATTDDSDGDGISDADEVSDDLDNPVDTDGDGVIDALDEDSDGDGIPDGEEAGDDPTRDTDGDGMPDWRDDNADGDGVLDFADNCRLVANTDQLDTDGDGIGDACTEDADGDGVFDADDNCPLVANDGQLDLDEDDIGDACDGDVDGDGVDNDADNCPLTPNDGQENLDGDGFGDACDDDIDGDDTENAGADDGCGCSSASGPSSMLSVVFVLLGLMGLRLRRGRIARD